MCHREAKLSTHLRMCPLLSLITYVNPWIFTDMSAIVQIYKCMRKGENIKTIKASFINCVVTVISGLNSA